MSTLAQSGSVQARFDRRTWLQSAGFATGAAWLTPLAHALADQAESEVSAVGSERPQSVILLWMLGGPSQLETFDPHPGTDIAGGTKAIDTAISGIQLAAGLPKLAEEMESVSLIRSLQSKEGDHERAVYLAKTGYRPDPVTVHPSLGAICCHELPKAGTEIPRHVSILPGPAPARGGFLGTRYDAFKVYDPANQVPDVKGRVSEERQARRQADLAFLERRFAAGRGRQVEAVATRTTVESAQAMMASEQLRAFDISEEPEALLADYGESPFGRGCLAARRLIEVGVRCVEVTLSGWDSHIDNHETHRELVSVLDPAMAALVRDLRQQGLLDQTVVLCMGEFGRTPRINVLDGHDHWPHGFSAAIAGGGLKGGIAVGKTDPEGGRDVEEPHTIADLHATIHEVLGIDIAKENISRAQRPIAISEGTPIAALL